MSKTIKAAFIKTDNLTENLIKNYVDSDVLMIIAKDYSKISVKDELSGASERLLWLGKLTAGVKGLAFASLITDNFGSTRRSVAVFSKGKLIKLCDAVNPSEKGHSPSYGYKSVNYGNLKLGIAVGKDLADAECLKCFSLCDCDLIINLSGDFYDFSTENLITALSYLYGTTILSVNADKSCAASYGRTQMITAERQAKLDITVKKTYREIYLKQRGNT